MLDSIQRFFQQALTVPSPEESTLTLELAAAVLLCEIVRADYHRDEAELAALRETLKRRYKLSDTAVEELMSLAAQEVEEAVDHHRFVSLLNGHYSEQQRFALVESMWRLAYADGELDPLEEHRIRRLADLLFLSHGDFIRAKLRVQKELNNS
ncbi:TerB family tellurite resistance protein [Pistricoccus aurantiacus]|uniref:TerB family tellurite resistance protein n=1 Tax=Pistricoccus aurantiacus TaxID=1883414 RepID=A0A5B8SYA7_9GAMM|nr:TerB family tellurite resistance protein [Pistricoccus aurantiacus]QEA39800.1 TerB family tellurite resistance protein [Pistricoccus aurantiacus]